MGQKKSPFKPHLQPNGLSIGKWIVRVHSYRLDQTRLVAGITRKLLESAQSAVRSSSGR